MIQIIDFSDGQLIMDAIEYAKHHAAGHNRLKLIFIVLMICSSRTKLFGPKVLVQPHFKKYLSYLRLPT